jgi:hypothetical protein
MGCSQGGILMSIGYITEIRSRLRLLLPAGHVIHLPSCGLMRVSSPSTNEASSSSNDGSLAWDTEMLEKRLKRRREREFNCRFWEERDSTLSTDDKQTYRELQDECSAIGGRNLADMSV